MILLPTLQFPESDLPLYASRYSYQRPAHSQIEDFYEIGPRQGYLTQSQLAYICNWKSGRRPQLAVQNDPALVEEVTGFAFSAKHPAAQMGALLILDGVRYPTASAILHYCVDPRIPILDYRALESLGIPEPAAYTMPFWLAYVQVCQELADRNGMSVREVDKALWQFSVEMGKGRDAA